MIDAKIRRYIAAIFTVGSGEFVPISCILAEIWRWSQYDQKSENSKVKATVQEMIAGRRGNVRNVICQSPYGFPEHKSDLFWHSCDHFFQLWFSSFRAHFCPFWLHLQCNRLPQLHRYRQCRWRQYIGRFMFWSVVGSPEGRYELILTFLQQFLATLIFEFSGTFLIISDF